MTDIYSGTGWISKTQVGECGNGDIYKGHGWGKTQIGSYKDGDIYGGGYADGRRNGHGGSQDYAQHIELAWREAAKQRETYRWWKRRKGRKRTKEKD